MTIFLPVGQRIISIGGGPRYVMPRSAAAAAGNGLLNNLIAYWPGNEANGNALDAHTNALHLTDTNTVMSNTGIVYALARQYAAVTSEYHTRAGDDALLSIGDIDFTIAAWVWLSNVASNKPLVSKYNVAGSREYLLYYSFGDDRFRFGVSNDGTATTFRLADTLGSPSSSVWYFIVVWHDSVANTVNIQVNNGGVDSAAHATGVFDGAFPFRIGSFASSYGDTIIGPTMFWKSAAGAGGVLTVAQRTALYNAGAGKHYYFFDGGAPVSLPADWWTVPGRTCVAAYQPKGAESLGKSYTNLQNPGTYDAVPGVAPTWAAATGWTFNGTTQYLLTGIVHPGNVSTWTAIVRLTIAGDTKVVFGEGSGGGNDDFRIYASAGTYPYYDNGGLQAKGAALSFPFTGSLCVAGKQGYKNGVADGAAIGAGNPKAYQIDIGAESLDAAGTPSGGSRFNGIVPALAIYSDTLTAPEVAALNGRMAAL